MRRLDQPHAAVVAVQLLVAEELVDAVELRQVAVGRDDLEVRALPQVHGRREVADDERDRLAEVPVGRVADEAGAGVGVGGDDHEEAPGRTDTRCGRSRTVPARSGAARLDLCRQIIQKVPARAIGLDEPGMRPRFDAGA